MKSKLAIFLMASILLCSLVFAAGQGNNTANQNETGIGNGEGQAAGPGPQPELFNGTGINETGNGQEIQEKQETRNKGEEEQLRVEEQQRVQVELNSVGQQIRQREQEMEQELSGMGEGEKKIYQNQNQVRLAVHALLEMKEMLGGIGPNVSAIAREFNNSVMATVRAEERVQNRNPVVRFLFGGDAQAAGELEQETNRNRERIQQLTGLMNGCECDEQVKAMLQEQIQSMEMEQNRLSQLASGEKNSYGLLGWIWRP